MGRQGDKDSRGVGEESSQFPIPNSQFPSQLPITNYQIQMSLDIL